MENIKNEIKSRLSIIDFPNVLNRVLLNTEYSINELEFEFDLEWKELEKLLDQSCDYEKTGDDKIIIRSKDVDKHWETNYDPTKDNIIRELKKEGIYAMFFRTGRYRSIKEKHFPKNHLELLDRAIKMGIIFRVIGGNLVLENHDGGLERFKIKK